MYDGELLQKLLNDEKNKVLKEVLSLFESKERFEKLLSIRAQVDKTAYAMYVRMVIQMDTHRVPLEMLFEALNELKQEDLMSEEEITKLNAMPEMLIIYRGTDANEYPPRISWSLLEDKARWFEQGKMYKAIINKHDIYAYFCSNGDEEEIIAHVTDNFASV
ncbi:hypothetical protein BN3590_03796 [Clostridium sp. C105KSO15]|nr:hypothetical protein BN3590_03796 [Clostridium sp. C105KSO15]